ncbi:hypothetical protein DQ04_02911020 [Trypanosoma grayi]|uniref:hypothetical protein n=1 Tax=Trypanosoma grayi TaxID=71804 RepID=UPI0004F4AB43|nr:hypothetical protein DQ04_02911020 [Trypanosoma grayi]KEG11164.1 hypothetical protein DQ04_02911020 [Trypanosoma grayi]
MTHPVYVVAERSLLVERTCLEHVQEIAEDVLLAKKAFMLAVAAFNSARSPTESSTRVAEAPTERHIAPPAWLTGALAPRMPLKQRRHGVQRVRYSTLGDAVVRSAWGGSS